MIKTTLAVMAMSLGLSAHAADDQHDAAPAAPAQATELKPLGASGQACKHGPGKGMGMMGCCQHQAGKMDRMHCDRHGGMDQPAMVERMRQMEKRMDLMQTMLEQMTRAQAASAPMGK